MERCAVGADRGRDGHDMDSRLIEACRQGSREAFRLLFETYRDRVYSIALYFLHGDENAAEDITQDVFLRLSTRIGQFRSEAEFSTWLYRLVANACVDEQRRRRRFVGYDEAMGGDRRADPDYDRFVLVDAIRAALADLNPSLRLTILLKYFDQLSYEEMAAALGCSKGTVASRLHRGHKILARKLAHLKDALF